MMKSSTVLVKTSDIWLGVSDAACEVNAQAFWAGHDGWQSVVAAVRQLENAHELLRWEVVLDGTYLIRFVVDDDAVLDAPTTAERCVLRKLKLPTGRVVVRSGEARTAPVQAVVVSPGEYDVRLEWFIGEECKHYDIENPETYPAAEGPDGIVTLRRARCSS